MSHASTVLVVDDGTAELKSVTGCLQSGGLEVVVSPDGRSVPEIARRVRPALILLDAVGDLDNLEICRQIRADEALRHTPIVLMADLGALPSRMEALPAGVDLVAKPVNGEDVLARVKTHIGLNEDLRRARRREAHYKALLENMDLGVTEIDCNYRIVAVNPAHSRMFGVPASEVVGEECFRVFKKRDAVCGECAGTAAIASWRQHEVELEGVRGDGSRFPVIAKAFPTFSDDGSVDGFIQIVKDISERRQASQAEARFERLRRLEESLLELGSLQEKTQLITDGVVDILSADFARVWLTKPGDRCDAGCIHADVTEGPHVCRQRDRCLHLHASSGRYNHIDGETHRRVPFGCYKIGRVAAGDEAGFLTNEVTRDPRVHDHEWARRLGLVSFAGYKLQAPGGEPIGVLALFSQHEISPAEEGLLETISGIASQVCQSAMTAEQIKTKEGYYRSLLHNLHEDILVIDRDYRITDVNRSSLSTTGAKREDLVGKLCHEALHGQSESCDEIETDIRCKLREVFETGEARTCYDEHVRVDGSKACVDILFSPLRDESGAITHVIKAVRDITDLVSAQEAAQASHARFQTLHEAAVDGVMLTDIDSKTFSIPNRQICEMLGYSADELCELTLNDIHPAGELQHVLATFERQAQGELNLASNIPMRRKDGTVIYADVSSAPVEIDGRRHLIEIFRDVTERRRAEEARTANVRFLERLDQINRAIQQSNDLEAMLWDVMRATQAIFDCDRAALMHPCDPDTPSFRVPVEVTRPEYPGVHATIPDHVAPATPDAREMFRAVLAADGPQSFGPGGDVELDKPGMEQLGVQSQLVLPLFPKTGKPWMFVLHQCSHPRQWTQEERRLFSAIGRRLADGLSTALMNRQLQQSEERFRALVEQAAEAFFLLDEDGQILDANRAACTSLDYSREELMQMSIDEVDTEETSQDHRERVWRRLCPGASVTFEGMHRCKDGSTFPVEVRLGMLELGDKKLMLALARNISDRKQAEEARRKLEAQLLRSQKLEAVGQLAGGVSHDFNNILTAIVGNVALNIDHLRHQLGPRHPAVGAMEEIDKAAQRAAALTRQLLTFSRRDIMQPEILNLNDILRNLNKMLQRLITENIALDTLTDREIHPVLLDPGQIEQVIVNLVVNAVHAMPDGGRLVLETKNVVLDDDYVATHADARPGPHVLLAVSDTGHGMDAATRERIFEPFFTTKPMEQGSGLGLSTVHGIIKQSGGNIEVYSEVGGGTTFKIYLPAVRPQQEAATGEAVDPRILRGTETVLLCEDEELVRTLTAGMLSRAGYEVLVTASGREAQTVAAAHEGAIDLLVTDVVMTDMNGRQLSDAIRLARSGLPTLFISGYTANVIAHHGVLDEGIEFLEKPFTITQLLSRVREVIDKSKRQ